MRQCGVPNLTPRLQALADWVAPSARIADVGTDHGYLPVWLVAVGRVQTAIAGDLRPGPLSRARETAARYGVSAQVDLRLCDGLRDVLPEEADTIVIAGMGGENIASILAAAPWTADGQHTLLLQPMTRGEILRAFLASSGYQIRREHLVEDRGTLYSVIEAGAGRETLSPGQLYAGVGLEREALGNRQYIEKILHLQNALAGLNRSTLPADREKADDIRRILTDLLRLREVWRRANG